MPQRTRSMAKRTLRAWPLLALFPAAAFAEEQMLLRLRQTQAAGSSDYELLHVQRGDFKPQAPLPSDQDGDLIVVGRDAQGRELFRRAVRNPGQLRAEIFDPATGRIVHSRDIQRSGGVVEVHVPQSAALASVDVIERPAAATAKLARAASATSQEPTPIRRFDRPTLDALDSASQPVTTNRKTASAGAGEARAAATAAAAAPSGSAWLWQSGPTNSRYDLVLIGDGYRSSDMAKWQADAQKVANGILADPLFAQNKSRLNIRRVDIASTDSGVTEGSTKRNSALGTVVGCYGLDRLVCPNETLAVNAVGAATPADGREVIIVVANSQIYGGSGGNVAAVTMHPQAIEIVLHEIGHTAFKLADEYESGTCATTSEPTEANVTIAKTKAAAKWGSRIAASTIVPTPLGYYPAGTVGLFLGGKYCTSGVYRPTEDSRMRTLGRPWYAVNEARANSVFAYYGGTTTITPSPAPTNAVTVSGKLAAGASANVPSSGSSQYSTNGGTFKMSSIGPANANFNLTLYKWNGSAWAVVAQTAQAGAMGSLTYTGTPGYYFGRITAASGSGNYTLTSDFPQ